MSQQEDIKKVYSLLEDIEGSFDTQLYSERTRTANRDGDFLPDHEFPITITEREWSRFSEAMSILEKLSKQGNS